MKTTLSLSIALLTFLGITKAAPPDTNAPHILIEAKFIEVTDGATDLLDSFATTGASPSVGGMLNDDQLSTLWKKIETTPGVDVLSMPRVTTQSGQEARIEIGREFAYKDADGKPATKQLGTVLKVLPKITGANEFDLEMSPRIVELERMQKQEGGGEQPIFRERGVTYVMKLTSGQTAVLGLPAASTKQTMVERTGETVTQKTEDVIRHAVVFVTARLVDPASGKPVDPIPADEKNLLQAKLDAIVIPQMQFHEAKLTEAVEYLRRKSQDLDTSTTDPNQKGVNMIVKADGNTAEARITLDLKNIPLGGALKYVAQLSGLQLVVEPHAVFLLPQADFESRQKQVESSAPNKPGMVITAESISIDKGTRVVDASGDLKIKTSQGTISTEQARVQTKPSAGEVLLPKVQFQDATLTEAVEFLRIKSRELDPGKKGLNILVKPDGDPKARITMDLKDVPAFEALRYVAVVAGCKLTVEGDVFVITPVQSDR